MHSLFFLLFFTLISSVYCQSNIPFETIILTNGKYRYKTDQTLVNGKVEQNIGEEYPRNYRILFSVEGGLLEGSYSYYYGNGQLSQVEFYSVRILFCTSSDHPASRDIETKYNYSEVAGTD